MGVDMRIRKKPVVVVGVSELDLHLITVRREQRNTYEGPQSCSRQAEPMTRQSWWTRLHIPYQVGVADNAGRISPAFQREGNASRTHHIQ